MKFSIKDFFSKCDQISNRKLRIGSHLVKKSLMENFIFCTVVDIRLLLGYIFPDFPWFFLKRLVSILTDFQFPAHLAFYLLFSPGTSFILEP